MYKILIADDDRIIRKGLASTIAWEQYGFELVGEAADGEQGLQLIKAHKPDIVISDIKMPFMDGLTMVRQAKELYPDLRAIFLTGYDDFAYAKEAINIRAFDYLLKPVDKEVLLEKVKKAADELRVQVEARQKINEGMPFFRHKFFKKLLDGTFVEHEMLQEARNLGMKLDGPQYVAFILKIDDYDTAETSSLGTAEARENTKQCIFLIGEKLVTEEHKGGIFELKNDELAVIYAADALEETMTLHARMLAEELRSLIKNSLGVTVTIAMGDVCHLPSCIGVSYQQARTAMGKRHFVGKDMVFSLHELGADQPVEKIEMLEHEAELMQQLKLGFAQEALEAVNKLEESLLQQKCLSLQSLRLLSLQLLVSLFKETGEWAKEWEAANKDKMELYYNRINGMQTIKEIMELVRSLVKEISGFIQAKRESSKCLAVEQAVQYMEENYSKQGLSLHEVANYIHMNPVYMSALFKQEKNITFSEFLLQTRMKKAMELLRRNSMKTYEVAECVGYSNPEYFSVCFKKYVGISPLEFRNKV